MNSKFVEQRCRKSENQKTGYAMALQVGENPMSAETCGSMADIQSPTAEIRQGKKERKKIEITGQKYNSLPYYIGQP